MNNSKLQRQTFTITYKETLDNESEQFQINVIAIDAKHAIDIFLIIAYTSCLYSPAIEPVVPANSDGK